MLPKSILVIVFIIFSSLLNISETANILAVLPMPSISHQVVFRPLTQELAKRGHDVTVITTDPAFPKGGAPANLTEIDVHDISYKIWIENFMRAATNLNGRKIGLLEQIGIIVPSVTAIFEAQIQTKEVQEILNDKNKKYDLIILEAAVRPALVFTHVFKAPFVFLGSLEAFPSQYELMGVSEHPILYPSIVRKRLFNLTMWEKISEIYTHLSYLSLQTKFDKIIDESMKKYFGPSLPTMAELASNVDMMFLNSNPVFAGIKSVPPNVIYMGGLHQTPSKPLPTDLKQYLDSSKNGVIYVSFGTNVDPTLLPADRIQMLVRVFSKLPYDVLFKWNSDELPGRTDNIKISKWLPQSDLLKHPKIKLFITQGGLQSTDESITAGVPLIGIPMLGDQWYNAERYEFHRIGMKLDIDTLTEETLGNAIRTVIEDHYRKNVARLHTLMQDQPMSPLERAMWWMEYVLRHGGAKHLRSPAHNISWAQYLELELVLTLLGVLLVTIAVVIGSVYYLIKLLFGKKCVRSSKKNN